MYLNGISYIATPRKTSNKIKNRIKKEDSWIPGNWGGNMSYAVVDISGTVRHLFGYCEAQSFGSPVGDSKTKGQLVQVL